MTGTRLAEHGALIGWDVMARKTEPITDLLERFREAHFDGMVALYCGDYELLGLAIAREREIIEARAEILAEPGSIKSKQVSF